MSSPSGVWGGAPAAEAVFDSLHAKSHYSEAILYSSFREF